MPSGSVLSDVFGSLRRRSSLRESIRSISSSYTSLKGKSRRKRTSSYQSYAVYEQTMFPVILRDPEATQRLLEAILDSPGGRRSLSRLARTCRAFAEPVLNILWRELDSLKTRRPGLGLARTPAEDDWKKIVKYGERVRKLSYNEAQNNVAPSIFPIFDEHRPKPYILPNLRQLVWKAETTAGLERCFLFLNPQLEGLTLDIGTKMPRLSNFLADMSSRTTKLKEFSFASPTPLPDTFTELLLPQKGLQKVALVAPGALAPGVGRWIASLEDLKVLQLDLTGRGVVAVEGFFDELRPRSGDSTPSSVMTTDSGVFSGEELDFSDIRKSALRLTGDLRSKGSFSSLRQLHLTGDVSNMAVFVKHLTSDLVQVDLVIEDPPDAADWQDMTALLSERFGESLQSLRISATATDVPSKRLTLEHFSALPSLVRLEIDLPESYLFTKADIEHLAKICPVVQDIKLCPLARFPVASGPPKITLEDLVPLISNCPRLHTLAAVVNAKGGSAATLGSRTASSRSLLRLHVGHSWVRDSLHVTILLSHLAPHLETLKWFHEKTRPGYIEAHAKEWEEVADALPHLQNVRLSERRWAAQLVEEVSVHGVEYSDESVDATVWTEEFGVQVVPEMAEMAVQFVPSLVDCMVDAVPHSSSVSVDATPSTAEMEIDACPEVIDESVSAVRPTTAQEVDATQVSVSKSVEALIESSRPSFAMRSRLPRGPSILHLVALLWRLALFFPITLPFKVFHTMVDKVSRRKNEPAPSKSENGTASVDICVGHHPRLRRGSKTLRK
ncbi:hypothetical protein BDZ89DRAFT_1060516 [Hymenopellis radicata]|nr:hypothetical protein BDZ89DRAFT_1060516 [Hymenopellis radicata]